MKEFGYDQITGLRTVAPAPEKICVRVPDSLRDAFEDLLLDHAAIRAKHAHFSEVVHAEEKMVAQHANQLWTEARAVMGIEGEWRYIGDGMLEPVRKAVADV